MGDLSLLPIYSFIQWFTYISMDLWIFYILGYNPILLYTYFVAQIVPALAIGILDILSLIN